MRWLAAVGGASGLGAAAASAALAIAAYPGIGVGWLALVAWVPLWARLRRGDVGPAGGFALGMLMGTVLHAGVFSWIATTMRDMSGMPAPVAAAALAGYALAMAPHQGVVAMWVAWDVRRRPVGARWVAGAAIAVVAAEVLIPYQFPWYLGNALYQTPSLHQAADLIGVQGVSGLCALFAAGCVHAAMTRGQARWLTAGAVALLLVFWVGYGQVRLAQHDEAPVQRTLRTLLVQHNPSLAEKQSDAPAPRMPMWERARQLTRTADRSGIELVIWSEGALPFFYVPAEADSRVPGRANALLRRISREVDALGRELGVPFLFGTLRRTEPTWRERARNSAVLLGPGQPRAVYDKRLLVPFGERMPGRDLIPALATAVPGVSDLGTGDLPAVLDAAGVAVGISICYENLFSDHVHQHHREADVLVNLTDDVWFGRGNATELHLMVQAARAVEMRRPLLRATATGVTIALDATGRELARAPLFVPTTLRAEVGLRALDAPFRRWGTWPLRILAWLALCAAAFDVVWARRQQPREDAAERSPQR